MPGLFNDLTLPISVVEGTNYTFTLMPTAVLAADVEVRWEIVLEGKLPVSSVRFNSITGSTTLAMGATEEMINISTLINNPSTNRDSFDIEGHFTLNVYQVVGGGDDILLGKQAITFEQSPTVTPDELPESNRNGSAVDDLFVIETSSESRYSGIGGNDFYIVTQNHYADVAIVDQGGNNVVVFDKDTAILSYEILERSTLFGTNTISMGITLETGAVVTIELPKSASFTYQIGAGAAVAYDGFVSFLSGLPSTEEVDGDTRKFTLTTMLIVDTFFVEPVRTRADFNDDIIVGTIGTDVVAAGGDFAGDLQGGGGDDVFIITRFQYGDVGVRDTQGQSVIKFDVGTIITQFTTNVMSTLFGDLVVDIKVDLSTGAVITIDRPAADARFQFDQGVLRTYDEFVAFLIGEDVRNTDTGTGTAGTTYTVPETTADVVAPPPPPAVGPDTVNFYVRWLTDTNIDDGQDNSGLFQFTFASNDAKNGRQFNTAPDFVADENDTADLYDFRTAPFSDTTGGRVGNDLIILDGRIPTGAHTIDGGAGDDIYFIGADLMADITIVDEEGDNNLLEFHEDIRISDITSQNPLAGSSILILKLASNASGTAMDIGTVTIQYSNSNFNFVFNGGEITNLSNFPTREELEMENGSMDDFPGVYLDTTPIDEITPTITLSATRNDVETHNVPRTFDADNADNNKFGTGIIVTYMDGPGEIANNMTYAILAGGGFFDFNPDGSGGTDVHPLTVDTSTGEIIYTTTSSIPPTSSRVYRITATDNEGNTTAPMEFTIVSDDPTTGTLAITHTDTNSDSTVNIGDTLAADTSGITDATLSPLNVATTLSFEYEWRNSADDIVGRDETLDLVAGFAAGTYTLKATVTDSVTLAETDFTQTIPVVGDAGGGGDEITPTITLSAIENDVNTNNLPRDIAVDEVFRTGIFVNSYSDGPGEDSFTDAADYTFVTNGSLTPFTDTGGGGNADYLSVDPSTGEIIYTADSGVVGAIPASREYRITAIDDEGTPSAFIQFELVSDAPSTGTLAITYVDADGSGTATIGDTLTADTSGITDTDDDSLEFNYTWLSPIAEPLGTDSPTLVLDDDFAAGTYFLTVTARDSITGARTPGFTATIPVAAAPGTPATGIPIATPPAPSAGTEEVDFQIAEAQWGFTDPDNAGGVTGTLASVNVRAISPGAELVDSTGAALDITNITSFDNLVLRPTEDYVGDVAISYTVIDNDGLESAVASFIVNFENVDDEARGNLTVDGAGDVGVTLTVNSSGLMDVDGGISSVFAHQWYSVSNNVDTLISGATSATFTPTDAGTYRVYVTTVDARGGTTPNIRSAPVEVSAVVAPNMQPTSAAGSSMQSEAAMLAAGDPVGAPVEAASATFTYAGIVFTVDAAGAAGNSFGIGVVHDSGNAVIVPTAGSTLANAGARLLIRINNANLDTIMGLVNARTADTGISADLETGAVGTTAFPAVTPATGDNGFNATSDATGSVALFSGGADEVAGGNVDTGFTFTVSDVDDVNASYDFEVLVGGTVGADGAVEDMPRFDVVTTGVAGEYKIRLLSGSTFDAGETRLVVRGTNVDTSKGTQTFTTAAFPFSLTITPGEDPGDDITPTITLGALRNDVETNNLPNDIASGAEFRTGILVTYNDGPGEITPADAMSYTFRSDNLSSPFASGGNGGSTGSLRVDTSTGEIIYTNFNGLAHPASLDYRITATDNEGNRTMMSDGDGGMVDYIQFTLVSDAPSTGELLITYVDTDGSGTATIGDTLMADTSGITDTDDDSLEFVYRWLTPDLLPIDTPTPTLVLADDFSAGTYILTVTARDSVTGASTSGFTKSIDVAAAPGGGGGPVSSNLVTQANGEEAPPISGSGVGTPEVSSGITINGITFTLADSNAMDSLVIGIVASTDHFEGAQVITSGSLYYPGSTFTISADDISHKRGDILDALGADGGNSGTHLGVTATLADGFSRNTVQGWGEIAFGGDLTNDFVVGRPSGASARQSDLIAVNPASPAIAFDTGITFNVVDTDLPSATYSFEVFLVIDGTTAVSADARFDVEATTGNGYRLVILEGTEFASDADLVLDIVATNTANDTKSVTIAGVALEIDHADNPTIGVPVVNLSTDANTDGTINIGDTLTALTTGITDADDATLDFSYQWEISTDGGASYEAIANATNETFTIAALGLHRVVVTAIDNADGGPGDTITLAPSAAITAVVAVKVASVINLPAPIGENLPVIELNEDATVGDVIHTITIDDDMTGVVTAILRSNEQTGTPPYGLGIEQVGETNQWNIVISGTAGNNTVFDIEDQDRTGLSVRIVLSEDLDHRMNILLDNHFSFTLKINPVNDNNTIATAATGQTVAINAGEDLDAQSAAVTIAGITFKAIEPGADILIGVVVSELARNIDATGFLPTSHTLYVDGSTFTIRADDVSTGIGTILGLFDGITYTRSGNILEGTVGTYMGVQVTLTENFVSNNAWGKNAIFGSTAPLLIDDTLTGNLPSQILTDSFIISAPTAGDNLNTGITFTLSDADTVDEIIDFTVYSVADGAETERTEFEVVGTGVDGEYQLEIRNGQRFDTAGTLALVIRGVNRDGIGNTVNIGATLVIGDAVTITPTVPTLTLDATPVDAPTETTLTEEYDTGVDVTYVDDDDTTPANINDNLPNYTFTLNGAASTAVSVDDAGNVVIATGTTLVAGTNTIIISVTDDETVASVEPEADRTITFDIEAGPTLPATYSSTLDLDLADYATDFVGDIEINVLDASGASGKQLIQGGNRADIITGSMHGDIIVSGYGADIITLANNNVQDILVMVWSSTEDPNHPDASNIQSGGDTVTGFERGIDKIVFLDEGLSSVSNADDFYSAQITLGNIINDTNDGGHFARLEGVTWTFNSPGPVDPDSANFTTDLRVLFETPVITGIGVGGSATPSAEFLNLVGLFSNLTGGGLVYIDGRPVTTILAGGTGDVLSPTGAGSDLDTTSFDALVYDIDALGFEII